MMTQDARLTILPNGLTVVTRYAAACATDIAVKIVAGSRDEVSSDVPRGTAHTLEHMICRGSEHYPQHLRTYIENLPGYNHTPNSPHHFTPATQFCFTNFYASIPADGAESTLARIGDAISNPTLKDADLYVQKRVIRNERLGSCLSFNHGSNMANWILPYEAHGRDPTLLPVIGTKEGMDALTTDDLRSFHQQNYRSGRIIIAVEGDIEHERILDVVTRNFTVSAGIRSPSQAPTYTGGDSRYWLPGDGGSHVVLAFQAPPEYSYTSGSTDERASLAFKVASRMLGAYKGPHSIPEALRSDDLAGYYHNCMRSQRPDTGLFLVSFSDMEVEPSLNAIRDILTSMHKSVNERAYQAVRDAQIEHINNCRSLFKVGAQDIANGVFFHGTVLDPDFYSRGRLSVTRDEVSASVGAMLCSPPTFIAAGDLINLPEPGEISRLFRTKPVPPQKVQDQVSEDVLCLT